MAQQDANTSPLIWPSVTRMVATIGIFLFHYLGLLSRPQYHLNFFALMTFCFLSGYLLNLGPRTRKVGWAVRHYFGVMVPHWLVIVPVIIANQVVHYKPAGIGSTIVTILGGNLFLANPLYVITWYVTFVLLLYGYALLESLLTPSQRIIFMVLGLVIFSILLDRGYYFLAFLAGLRLADWRGTSRARPASTVANTLFVIQRYCYSFFLLHGAVLLFFFTQTRLAPLAFFALAFLTSALLAIAVYAVARPLQRFAVTKSLGLGTQALDTSPAV